MKRLRAQKGFTLIELVMIIVILGILAAVAVPRYVDLAGDARTAACRGANGSLHSQAAISIAQTPRGAKAVSVIVAALAVDGVVYARVVGPPDLVDIDLDEDGNGVGDFDCGADIDLVTPGLAVDG